MTSLLYPTVETGSTSGNVLLDPSLLYDIYTDIQATCFDLIISHHQVGYKNVCHIC
jgi:hypothetical protein